MHEIKALNLLLRHNNPNQVYLVIYRFLFAFDRRSPKRLSKNQAGQNVVLHIRELVTISSGLQVRDALARSPVHHRATQTLRTNNHAHTRSDLRTI
ncbi:hypothetical protein ILYODFUR_011664 [Ilyodon furcidens]|uniref:Uncharacterized protein n=1 Tax=Ilyodon furcidens TaxID=33524 RepID=A0ABV0V334_9TELE